jgi:hypothetical protein
MITSEQFLTSFKAEWTSLVSSSSQMILDIYPHKRDWTSFMLGTGGFLTRVMDRLNKEGAGLEYRSEYYTIDALFVSGKDLFREHRTYPSELHVLIEHENADNIEEEMWKLLFWRAPLKVIIFYDWNEYEKPSSAFKQSWLKGKLKKLVEMRNTVNEFYPENQKTEYLLIFGNREYENQMIRWQCVSDHQPEPKPL